MILAYLILILLAGSLLALLTGRKGNLWPRVISVAAVSLDLVLLIIFSSRVSGTDGKWLMDLQLEWIPRFGISLHLALDGLSLVMVLLTLFLGIISVVISWKEINSRVGFFHFNLLLILAGIIGVFLSLDLFLFYFFWEMMLVPMYFLIALWGH